MAFLAVCGGVLNIFNIISPQIITAMFFIGQIFFVVLLYTKRNFVKEWFLTINLNKCQSYIYLTLFILLGVVLILFLLSANGHFFNEHDDFHAYLVYPYKMLQTGSLGIEPFNERRLGIYGGLSFLQTMIIGVFNIHQPHLMETGLSWVIIIALILGYGRQKNWIIFIIIAFLLHFVKMPSVNSSSLLSGSALFLTIIISYKFLQKENINARIFIISVAAAGLCSLKSSFIPACGLILLLLFLFAREKAIPIKYRIGDTILIGILVIFFLLPWMIAMHQSNATFLYPLLGNGIHGSTYSSFPHNTCGSFNAISLKIGFRHLFIENPFLLSMVLLGLSLFKRGKNSVQFKIGLSVFIGSWPFIFMLYIISGGISRYTFPISFAVILFQLCDFFYDVHTIQYRIAVFNKARFNILVLIFSFILIFSTFGWRSWQRDKEAITHPKSAWNEKYAQQIRKAQQTVPKGTPLLSRVSMAHMLDFTHNQVFTVDWPGGSGPAPGLPCFGKAEELVEYLLQHNIRYIIYSYGDESGHSRKKYQHRLRFPGWYMFGRVKKLAEYSFAFQDRLVELKNKYKNLYHDKRFVVIDISIEK
ncbi:MAG: hypothetical protein ABIK92_07105 [Pseudomonadota bacterium]